MALVDTSHTHTGSAGTPSPCVASGNAMVLLPATVTSAVPLVRKLHTFCRCPAAPHHIFSVITRYLHADAGRGCSASDSMPYSHGHGLGSVAKVVVTATNATVSDVVGMTGTEAGHRVQNATMKVQWYGLLPSSHLNPCHPFLFTTSTSSTWQRCRPSLKRHIPPRRPIPRIALRQPCRAPDSPHSPEAPRWITGTHARARPARPVDAT